MESFSLHPSSELESKTERLKRLASLAQTVTASLDIQRVFEAVVEGSLQLLNVTLARLWVVEPLTGEIVLVAWWASPRGEPVSLDGAATRLRMGEGIPGWVIDQRCPRYSPVLAEDPLGARPEWVKREGFVSQLAFPLIRGGQTLGVLVVTARERREFPIEERELLETFAATAAIAIENARLHEGLLEQMAALKRTQAQLVQSTKLAALGELAAQIAHEINNPLTSVLGYASLLLKDSNLSPAIRGDLDVIAKESIRARRIVRDLLEFARRREPHMEPGDLNGAVRSVLDLLRESIVLGNVRVVENLAPLPSVLMDSDQMKQVFLNLINNAVEAMPEGGTLTITTGVWDSGSGVPGSGTGDQVEVVVADTGAGMSLEQIDQIFDPFYTTKGNERGTGLGLSVSRGIIEEHGGRILVESRPGCGSAFRVILPLRIPHAKAKSADLLERNG